MTLQKEGCTFTATCDHCGDDWDTEETEFMSAVETMKREGWRITKRRGEWDHQCPDCQDDGSDDFEDVS